MGRARSVGFLGALLVLSAGILVQACTSREVVGVVVGSVSVSPGTANLLEGETFQFGAVVRDDRGETLDAAEAEWTSADPTIASVAADGTVSALLRGVVEIRAEFQGVIGRATVTVLQAAGITVTPASGPTTESGGTATFTVTLDSQPTADVTVALSSSDPTEGRITAPANASLTFTSANWNVAQTVTVVGQNDALADGNVVFTIVTAPALSADPRYNGIDAADVPITNNDDDSASITVSPVSGPTTETGGTATFTLVLSSQPSADVTVTLSSSDPSEGAISTGSLTFTTLNWNAARTVTVTGQNDAIADGNVTYTIVTAPASSADPTYDGLDAPDVSVTNVDDETAGITVSPASRATTEAGGQATFRVVLNAEPTANVTIPLASNDPGEGTISTSSLTFTVANWDVAQTVTVTGQDDDIDDGDVVYTIVTAPATSTDVNYDGVDGDDVSVTNVDDETAAITVSPVSGPTTESGGTATFTVVLSSRPTANVTMGLSSSNPSEGTISTSSLTFTPTAGPDAWDTPHTVTVTGQNDAVADGNVVYTILIAPATSADAAYSGVDAADVSVTNIDDESAGVTVSPISGPTAEAGGQATFTVVLNTAPTANVSMTLTSSNPSEGTLSVNSLTFTSTAGQNAWNTLHVVTVTGQNDDVDDGDVAYTIVTAAATSADPKYNGLDAADVAVTNVDDDVAGVTVSPVSGPTTEAGVTATFTAVLTSRPTADVTIALSSSAPSEGTISTSSLTFTAAAGTNAWNTPHMVTVTGQNDALADGNVVYTILTAPATSADAKYNGIDAADVSVTNVDDETAGITVSPISGPTTEAGGPATFTVVLNSQPTADVTIGVASNDSSEAVVTAPAGDSLTFTSVNWNSPQTVTVTGQDDDVDDDDVAYTIVTAPATSTDASYDAINAVDVLVTNNDDDAAGISVSPVSGPTTEAGGTAQFTVVLTSEPTASVTIGVASSDNTEGVVTSTTPLVFTLANWSNAQTVIVTGQNDAAADGNVAYAIQTAPATSIDLKYSGMNAADVPVTNVDDEVAQITVSPVSGPTTEAGGTATFTVVLSSQPTAGVTIGVMSNDTTEGRVTVPVGGSLTFTTGNWSTAQTVTVMGQNDDVDDGNVVYQILTDTATSTDPNYDGIDPANVSVTNIDDETAGMTVSPISGPTTEGGSTATFTVVLNSQPTADVTIGIMSSDTTEGRVTTPAGGSLTFTPTTWSTPQTVTVAGEDDPVADGNVVYAIVTAPATSMDLTYASIDPPDVSVTNVDDETVGITVSPASGPTSESGGQAAFSIVLNVQPTDDVTIGVASNNSAEGAVTTPAGGSLTFTPANWSTPQTVRVTGVDDLVDDGDIDYAIETAPASSADQSYNSFDAADVPLTNTDNDTAQLSVNDVTVTEGNASPVNATFSVSLSVPSTQTVTVQYATANGTATAGADYTAIGATTLTFNPGVTSQPVTVAVLGDLLNEANETFAVNLSSPLNATIADGTGVGTINDNDPPPSLSINDVTVTELDAGTVNASFTVTLSTVSGQTVTVQYATSNGTATAPADYTAIGATTLTFSPGTTTQPVTVVVAGDLLDEVNEAFTVGLSNATNATIADATGAGTITDNDPPPSLSIGDGTVTEGNAGTVSIDFTVTLSASSGQTVTVQYATANGTATDASDYTATSGTLTFTPGGALTQTVTVVVAGDQIDELNETFNVTLSIPTNATIATGTGVGTITDDDTSTLAIDNVTVTEGNTGTVSAVFTVTKTLQSSQTVTVDYATANVTATAGADYTATSGTLTFTPGGALTQTATVVVAGDQIDELNEAYNVTLSNATGGATIAVATGVGTITDDDTSTLAIDNVTVTEGNTGTVSAVFTVTKTLQSSQTVTVDFATANVTATAGADYTATSGTLTFTPGGALTQTVTIVVQGEQTVEANETYNVTLSNATGGATIAVATGVGTITNNDVPDFTVTQTNGTTVATEGGATDTLSIVLTAVPDPSAPVVLTIASADPTQVGVNPTQLSFNDENWSTPQIVVVTAVDDGANDGDLSSLVTISIDQALSNTLWLGVGNQQVSATAIDNDP